MSQVTDKTSLTAIPGDPYSREEKKKKKNLEKQVLFILGTKLVWGIVIV